MGVGNAVFLSLKISTQITFTTLMLAVNCLTVKLPVAVITRTARTMCQIALFSRWIICRNCVGCLTAVPIVCYWYPLVSGNPISPVLAGQSVAGRIFPETVIDEDDLPDHITDW